MLPGWGFPSPHTFSAERPQCGLGAGRNASPSRRGSGAGLEQPRFTGKESETAERRGPPPAQLLLLPEAQQGSGRWRRPAGQAADTSHGSIPTTALVGRPHLWLTIPPCQQQTKNPEAFPRHPSLGMSIRNRKEMEFSLLIPEKEKTKKCWQRGARRGRGTEDAAELVDGWPRTHSSAVSVAVGPQGALAREPLCQGPQFPDSIYREPQNYLPRTETMAPFP